MKLSILRRIVAVCFFTAITLLFLDFTGIFASWFGWTAKLQLFPAILALNVAIIVALVVLTLLFGRLYCSVICPMGIWQDLSSRLRTSHVKLPFRHAKALNWLRYPIWLLFVVACVAGFGAWAALIEPYSAWGRVATHLFAPAYDLGNNAMAAMAERADSYAFYAHPMRWWGWMAALPAIATFVLVTVLAVANGRIWCNSVCPVGTTLGFLSRFSLFRFCIDTDKCNGCTVCARRCKSSCIDPKAHAIDHSRCVTCFNCIDNCRQGAISYRPAWKCKSAHKAKATADAASSRRSFLLAGGLFLTGSAIKAQEKVSVKLDGGLATLEPKHNTRKNRITPPGSASASHFFQHCVDCQLCISACPNHVLVPSHDLTHFMQPEVSYDRGWCRPECTRCSEVCPTGAIKLITAAQKTDIHVGRAVWQGHDCVGHHKGECNACERHCPTGAITMRVKDPSNPKSSRRPVVDETRCIGCGACEYVCPARPRSAIHVEGYEQHR